ncbi:MAG: SsrA-binding protein SmpB [Sphaerochaeta sp.]|jgi:SsrA-binding protein|nr:SsrA-binding protein SmpB [Sphaerochaeta sp.]HHT80567.1 SsrA-binding protein SmpB [Spirochaetales bacterium]
MKQNKNKIKFLQKNRKAYFNYEVIEDLECGIALMGTEVKSIREGKFSFSDSYVTVSNNALTLVGLTIQPYTHGNLNNHEPLRNRRLLAHKAEIKKFKRKVDERGFTLIPTSIYLKGNLVKVQISLCRGKQMHDKRAAAKEKDMNRDMRRELKQMQF